MLLRLPKRGKPLAIMAREIIQMTIRTFSVRIDILRVASAIIVFHKVVIFIHGAEDIIQRIRSGISSWPVLRSRLQSINRRPSGISRRLRQWTGKKRSGIEYLVQQRPVLSRDEIFVYEKLAIGCSKRQ